MILLKSAQKLHLLKNEKESLFAKKNRQKKKNRIKNYVLSQRKNFSKNYIQVFAGKYFCWADQRRCSYVYGIDALGNRKQRQTDINSGGDNRWNNVTRIMEFGDVILQPKIKNVTFIDKNDEGNRSCVLEGTLCITGHHLIMSSTREIWVRVKKFKKKTHFLKLKICLYVFKVICLEFLLIM